MARMTRSEALTAISEKVNTAGGQISHRQLATQLQSEGKSEALSFLDGLKSRGEIIGGMQFVEGEALPTTVYALPPTGGN